VPAAVCAFGLFAFLSYHAAQAEHRADHRAEMAAEAGEKAAQALTDAAHVQELLALRTQQVIRGSCWRVVGARLPGTWSCPKNLSDSPPEVMNDPKQPWLHDSCFQPWILDAHALGNQPVGEAQLREARELLDQARGRMEPQQWELLNRKVIDAQKALDEALAARRATQVAHGLPRQQGRRKALQKDCEKFPHMRRAEEEARNFDAQLKVKGL